jgi:hypothetical protein
METETTDLNFHVWDANVWDESLEKGNCEVVAVMSNGYATHKIPVAIKIQVPKSENWVLGLGSSSS